MLRILKLFQQAPFSIRAFSLYVLAVVVSIFGAFGWLALNGSREFLEFVQAFSLSLVGYVFALVMVGVFASDPRPRYLRRAMILLWLGTILCGVRVLLTHDGLTAALASAGIALFWTVVLEATARQAVLEGR